MPKATDRRQIRMLAESPSLHLFSGTSSIGDVRVDFERPEATYRRATATPAEVKMMDLLTRAAIHWEWQAPTIERYDEIFAKIAKEGMTFYKTYTPDFCIMPDRKILIEIDGKAHDKHEEYDAKRTAYLEKRGYIVMRFSNRAVLKDGLTVIRAVQTEIARRS